LGVSIASSILPKYTRSSFSGLADIRALLSWSGGLWVNFGDEEPRLPRERRTRETFSPEASRQKKRRRSPGAW